MDDESRASSREFEEPNLPWAQGPVPAVQFGGEDRFDGFACSEHGRARKDHLNLFFCVVLWLWHWSETFMLSDFVSSCLSFW